LNYADQSKRFLISGQQQVIPEFQDVFV